MQHLAGAALHPRTLCAICWCDHAQWLAGDEDDNGFLALPDVAQQQGQADGGGVGAGGPGQARQDADLSDSDLEPLQLVSPAQGNAAKRQLVLDSDDESDERGLCHVVAGDANAAAAGASAGLAWPAGHCRHRSAHVPAAAAPQAVPEVQVAAAADEVILIHSQVPDADMETIRGAAAEGRTAASPALTWQGQCKRKRVRMQHADDVAPQAGAQAAAKRSKQAAGHADADAVHMPASPAADGAGPPGGASAQVPARGASVALEDSDVECDAQPAAPARPRAPVPAAQLFQAMPAAQRKLLGVRKHRVKVCARK